MKVALLTIGTELTRGELHNTNSGWLAEQLSERGYEVTAMLTVDDDDERMISALRDLSRTHQAVVCTGGLGPTTDDRTSACAAAALGLSMVRDEASLEAIKEMFRSRGYEMSPSNEKQADFPEGAQVITNARGTAPGFFVDHPEENCRWFFLPGVPAEMQPMFEDGVVPSLPPVAHPVTTARLKLFGMPEAEVNDRLRGIEEEQQVTIGYRASHSEIEVKVLTTAREGESESELQKRAEAVLDVCHKRLGAVVYGRGKTSIPAEIGRLLKERGLSLALAESCTGGLVSQLITSVPGASEYYFGGVCTYANSAKQRILHVSSDTLEAHGAVSEEVAKEMASGAREALGADVALSFTGIAGPGGGTDEKPVGLVHWAVATKSQVVTKHRVFRGNRAQIQRRAALNGLWTLRSLLLEEAR